MAGFLSDLMNKLTGRDAKEKAFERWLSPEQRRDRLDDTESVYSPLRGENPRIEREMFEAIKVADAARLGKVLDKGNPDFSSYLRVRGVGMLVGAPITFSPVGAVIALKNINDKQRILLLDVLFSGGADFVGRLSPGDENCMHLDYAKELNRSDAVQGVIKGYAEAQERLRVLRYKPRELLF